MRAEADFDPKVFEDRYSDEKKVWVRFYVNLVEDQQETEKQGRPIFKEKEYVEIRTPGNETNILNRPVSQMDKDRFPRHYELFQRGLSDAVVGTPLSEMLWVKRTMAEELKYLKILTVEHLAAVNDDVCGRVPGLTDLKTKARQYLEAASKPDVDNLLARIAALEAQLATPDPVEEE
jgi:hypothetical protein